MKGKIILLSTLVLLTLSLAVAPAFAALPKTGTFSQGIISIGTNPGTQYTVGDQVYVRNSVASDSVQGAPWGNTIMSTETDNSLMNPVSLIGNALGFTTDVYAAGNVKGIAIVKLNGVGPFTYNGPTFTFTVGSVTVTATHGTTYFGVLLTGSAVKYGINGGLKGLMTAETFVGVGLSPTISIIYVTGSYKL